MYGATDEAAPLTVGGNPRRVVERLYKIEKFRLWGLLAFIPLMFSGAFVTNMAVVFPPKEDPSSFWDKIWNGAPSDFDETQTYIYQMFHFSHPCSFLDFNPAKTIAAIMVMLHILPMEAFVILHYFRIVSQTDPKYDTLKKATKISTPLQFIFYHIFYMVFVNSPEGDFDTPDGDKAFIHHYIPYALWQIATLLTAIQQCWFIVLRDSIPFEWATPALIWKYLWFMTLMVLAYQVMVFSFIFKVPILNTEEGFGRFVALFLVYSELAYAVAIPAFFSYYEEEDGEAKIIFIDEYKEH